MSMEANRQTQYSNNIRVYPFLQIHPCELVLTSPGNGGGERVPCKQPAAFSTPLSLSLSRFFPN